MSGAASAPRKTAQIAEAAKAGGSWKAIRPYLEALAQMAKRPSNIAASARQRLLNLARAQNQTFDAILVCVALDRSP